MFLNSDNKDNNKSFTCQFHIFSANILHFMLIIPYIFRGLRLLNVFNLKYYNSNRQKYRLKEAYYLKVFIYLYVNIY